jgi:hypothetical protein
MEKDEIMVKYRPAEPEVITILEPPSPHDLDKFCPSCDEPDCKLRDCGAFNCTSSAVEIRLPYERLRQYLTRDGGGRRKLPRRDNSHHQAYHPSSVRIDERPRRQLIATRDIAEGEVILRETPLIAAPSAKEFPTKRSPKDKDSKGSKFACLCLGCYKNVTSLYKCSKCGWPVCDKECEKVSLLF